ncbi:arylsulfatase [Flammeovirga kamogawensis]|uniref:Arylsulfatase n=1 Tax=Flammeovirga kamogawensis TaxID=373891 RepID=A0ABX8GYQ3_9BACT|nr:arylsulfatase [Flammeovirga kamogawensis]MBB6458963.1 arylsulfatase [Flammeovirga kamogawensis]QWG08538.1 arylsulfatase [Flammeovirga kamogawensis]TRX66830.1 arylsulfatase [Flammeovirga kamogawensis]
MNKKLITVGFLLMTSLGAFAQKSKTKDRPNILVIMGDDIGYGNVSTYNNGMLAYQTPNIDEIGKEGVVLTSEYGQQSCTAGRAAFITGQSPLRTGLTTIGMPGSKIGLQDEDATIAELLKPYGYATGQFGKNHLGDRDEFLPTNHGFDEFYGNLYHLNAEEEPEDPAYPTDPAFKKKYGPRGVIHSYADGHISDTGPLTKKRMEDVDEDFLQASERFMTQAVKDDKPFFVWFNSTRMHAFTHLNDKYKQYLHDYGLYGAGMKELDDNVGLLLNKLEELGVAENTIVIFTTDNGVEKMTWPDGGISPFRGEKGSTWEGGVRVPFVIRYPKGIKNTGRRLNGIVSHEDMMPTLYAAATGDTKLVEKMKEGMTVGDKTFKLHLDGYNQWDYFTGKSEKSARDTFFYVADNGMVQAMRWNDWKIHFVIQEGEGPDMWFSGHRFEVSWPKIYNLAQDPYEAADHSGMYLKWYGQKMWLFVPAKQMLGQFFMSFKDFPPRQRPETLSPGKMQEMLYQMMDKGAAKAGE